MKMKMKLKTKIKLADVNVVAEVSQHLSLGLDNPKSRGSIGYAN